MKTLKYFVATATLSLLMFHNSFRTGDSISLKKISNQIKLHQNSNVGNRENYNIDEIAQINKNNYNDQDYYDIDNYNIEGIEQPNNNLNDENDVFNTDENNFINDFLDDKSYTNSIDNFEFDNSLSDNNDYIDYYNANDDGELNSLPNSISNSPSFDVIKLYHPPQLSATDFKSDGNTIDILSAQTHPHDSRQIGVIVKDFENRSSQPKKKIKETPNENEMIKNIHDNNNNEPIPTSPINPSSEFSGNQSVNKSSNSISGLDYAAIIIGALGGLFISLAVFGICIFYVKVKANKQKKILMNSNQFTEKQLNEMINV